MYLKEIKIQGFKSFADRINIELNNGLIGIVGPNGSGKSNIVDAIRWVLGEQSIKSLRGSEGMTDVLFSGTSKRNPVNVASVSLIFDNSDKYIPLDYNEVSIKRKIYRDGTNEYYINNEQCRLKDISNLFLDSGSSKESFNIISQGKIEEILTDKPHERRVIFEEAAGVLKYKKRKEEALRKLERTNDNMERVQDIITELKNQINPLKNQKEAALKYLDLKKELENIEISLITFDITNINYNYQQKKDQIKLLEEQINNISNEFLKNEITVEEYKQKIIKIDEKINEYQTKLLEATKEVEKINTDKQILLERKKYEVDDSKLHSNIIELKEKKYQIENNILNLEHSFTNKFNELERFNKQILELKEGINVLITNKGVLEQELTKLIREKIKISNIIEQLKLTIETNSFLPASVLKILNNPKLRGIHNTLANLIEVEKQYSVAITTAIVGGRNNIIVDNETSAKEAINYLKNNSLGRATFLPINVIKPRFIEQTILNNLFKIKGFVNSASKLVKYDLKYENIIKNQLGNVLVVTDLDCANLISKQINYRYRVITLAGEVINVGGSITGGDKLKTKNIILEKYELEKNLKIEQGYIKNIQELENKINDNDYNLKKLEDKLYLLNREKLNEETICNNIKNEILTLKENLKTAEKEITGTNNIINKTLSEEEDNIINLYYNSLKNKDEVNNQLNFYLKEKDLVQHKLDEIEYLLKQENNKHLEKTKKLQTLEVEVNRMDVQLDNLLNNLNETYSITYEAAIKKYILELDPKVARLKVKEYKEILKKLGVVNLGAIEEYERITKRYDFLNKQLGDLNGAKEILLNIIDELDSEMKKRFLETFEIIKKYFQETFKELFKGGEANLKLTDSKNLLQSGIEIIASPPGKKLTTINLLSGGEKALTAISLLFAILKSRPVPFCVLDEADSAFDEINVLNFGEYLTKLKKFTQFIVITHKKKTMQFFDLLYGVTMQETGVSKLVSVKLE